MKIGDRSVFQTKLQQSVDGLRSLVPQSPAQTAELLGKAQQQTDLHRALELRRGYVGYKPSAYELFPEQAQANPQLAAALAAEKARVETTLVHQALVDVSKVVLQRQSPVLQDAVTRLPETGLDVLQSIRSTWAASAETNKRQSGALEQKLGLTFEQATQLLESFRTLSTQYHRAAGRARRAERKEALATVQDVAAQVSDIVSERLHAGAIDRHTYDKLKALAQSLPLPNPLADGPRALNGTVVDIYETEDYPEAHDTMALIEGIQYTLALVKAELGIHERDAASP